MWEIGKNWCDSMRDFACVLNQKYNILRYGILTIFLWCGINVPRLYAQAAPASPAPAPVQNVVVPTLSPPAAPAPVPEGSDKANDHDASQKIVNNPFVPGGVISGGQMVSRTEMVKLLDELEKRMRHELNQGPDLAEVSKLVANAANNNAALGSFLGCVNGVPLYRGDDGTLTFSKDEPEAVRKAHCSDNMP